jgi:hypothetical protein
MSWIGDVFGSSIGNVLGGVDKILGRFKVSETEKQAFKLELEKLLQQRDSELETTFRTELQAKERVLVAELQQGDSYTKRARPTVVYAGLFFTALNYCVIPIVQQLAGQDVVTPTALPTEFWWAWGGICGTWVIGRSAERVGVRNRVTKAMSYPSSGILD